MEQIFVWAGDLDIFSIIDLPFHASPQIALEDTMLDLEDAFGKGVVLNKISNNRYQINVNDVRVC